MKIRNDFVSNSSSVSYIITMKREIVELFERQYKEYEQSEKSRIKQALKDDLLQNGTRIYMDGEELYFKKYQFQTDGDINTREYITNEGKEVDLDEMSDEEIWAYIYGEYIMNNGISGFTGFGSTQVDTY